MCVARLHNQLAFGDRLYIETKNMGARLAQLSSEQPLNGANWVTSICVDSSSTSNTPNVLYSDPIISTVEMDTNKITWNQMTLRHDTTTTVVVTIMPDWPQLPGECNYHEFFPQLQHLVLKSWPLCPSRLSYSIPQYTSFLKTLIDWSATLVSIDMTGITHTHGRDAGKILIEMLKHTNTLTTLKVEFDILDKLCKAFHTLSTTIANILTIVVVATVNWPGLNADSSFEWLWRWATTDAVDMGPKTLYIEIDGWNVDTVHRLSFNIANCIPPWDRNLIDDPTTKDYVNRAKERDTQFLNAMINTRNGLARFILTVCGCTDDERILASISTWNNYLQFFVKPSTLVTLNFTFCRDDANQSENTLLHTLMLYTTASGNRTDINITIPQEREDHTYLRELIADFYSNVMTRNRETFGSVHIAISNT